MAPRADSDSYAYCRDLVRRADKDRFLSILFAPAERRDHLYALYGFNVEVAQVREKVSNALPGEVRLQWWCEALAGCGHGEVMRHPVAAALIDTLERFALPAEPLIDLVEARTFDLYDEPMATVADLETYLDRTSSAPIRVAARILGAPAGDPVEAMARHGGIAFGLAGLMCSIRHQTAQGKLFVPEELLARHGVPPQDVLSCRRTAALDGALAELRALARRHLESASAHRGSVPAEAVPALLPLALVRPYLDRMERRSYDPFSDCTIAQWRRQWIIWRAARRAG